MKFRTILAGAALIVPATLAFAAGTPTFNAAGATQLAQQNACFGCHQVDRKVVGPSFLQIAAKYKSDPAAETKLMTRIKDGGSGDWGVIPMPAHPTMSDTDLRTLSSWILAGSPH